LVKDEPTEAERFERMEREADAFRNRMIGVFS